jgi:Uma2 family endonuclease
LVLMAAAGGAHILCVNRSDRWFNRHVGEDALVSVQNPLLLSDDTEPEPDIVILRFGGVFTPEVPRAEDVLLLMEVADSSLLYDRRTKLPLYAAAGIPEVWIANLRDRQVEVYRDPAVDRYQTAFTAARGRSITPVALPYLTVPVVEILG